jgi:hypothetical protein
MPSADDVLVAAIELVLTGAGLPKVTVAGDGHPVGTGFLAAPVEGGALPRASVTWHENGVPAGASDSPAGKLRNCEQALRRAGFHVENSTETTGECLLTRRGTRADESQITIPAGR